MTGQTHLAPDARNRDTFASGLDTQPVNTTGFNRLCTTTQQTLVDDTTGQSTRSTPKHSTRQPKSRAAKPCAKRCTHR
jgi:hypothetical protein